MKNPRERAEEIAALMDWEATDARRLSFVVWVEKIIGETLRDQRHQCATAVLDTADDWGVLAAEILNRAHAAVMNARAPGT